MMGVVIDHLGYIRSDLRGAGCRFWNPIACAWLAAYVIYGAIGMQPIRMVTYALSYGDTASGMDIVSQGMLSVTADDCSCYHQRDDGVYRSIYSHRAVSGLVSIHGLLSFTRV